MTVREIFEDALALVGTDTSVDDSLLQYAVQWTNLCMSELFYVQNSIYLSNGRKEMASPPRVKNLDEEIPYDPRLWSAFIYYLASWIYKDDRELTFSQEMYNRFVDESRMNSRMVSTDIEDVYWGNVDA